MTTVNYNHTPFIREWLHSLTCRVGGPTLLAKVLNISRQTVHKWISGRNTPDSKNRIALAVALRDEYVINRFAEEEQAIARARIQQLSKNGKEKAA